MATPRCECELVPLQLSGYGPAVGWKLCPLHKAAPRLYEALEHLSAICWDEDDGELSESIWVYVPIPGEPLLQARAALAAAAARRDALLGREEEG